jgi:hypothetical protein
MYRCAYNDRGNTVSTSSDGERLHLPKRKKGTKPQSSSRKQTRLTGGPSSFQPGSPTARCFFRYS